MDNNPWFNILDGDSPVASLAAVLGQEAAPSSYYDDPDSWRNPLDEDIEAEAQAWNAAALQHYQKHVWPFEDAAGQERSPLPPTPSPGQLHNRRQKAETRRQREDEYLQFRLAMKALEFALVSVIK
jgi:hypothetical protein